MSKQALAPYLELRKTAVTCFPWQNDEHNVRQAPANVFDAWIRQYVETIKNVDTSVWDKFHRWQIINTVLSAGLLEIVENPDGTWKLQNAQKAEQKSSDEEEKSSVGPQTEALPSITGAELQGSGIGK